MKSSYALDAAVYQAQADGQWIEYQDRVEEIEALIESMDDCLIRGVLSLVVIQLYLNQINRKLEDV